MFWVMVFMGVGMVYMIWIWIWYARSIGRMSDDGRCERSCCEYGVDDVLKGAVDGRSDN